VDMVKPGPAFIPWMNRELAEAVRQEVEANGVGLYPGHEIKGIERGKRGSRSCARIWNWKLRWYSPAWG
jgi:NADPH-dependent 2,4-dienoyl-CoA reductase/sulfur reductase-like enzyme